MFERFTERSRRAILFAQDEARLLEHSSIGTAHVLAGLIHEADGIGGRALISLGLSLVETRAEVVTSSDELLAGAPSPEPIPFAADAKGLLELAPREALRLGHRNIGTEHLALAITSQPHSAAVQVLTHFGVDCARLRARILELLALPTPTPTPSTMPSRRVTTSVQMSPETQALLARSARKALRLGVAYASKRSLPMRLLGTAGTAALGMSPTPTPPAPSPPSAASSLTPAVCSFCGTPSPGCGTLFSGATGALICAQCVKGVAPS